jgi:hypothetical protein
MYFSYSRSPGYLMYGWIIDNGVIKIGHISVVNKVLGSRLELLLYGYEKAPMDEDLKKSIEDYLAETNEERLVHVDYIGPGIRGAFAPESDRPYLVKGQDSLKARWVKAHEFAHRRREYMGEPQDEFLVDMEATATVGYMPFPDRFYVK